MCVCVCVYHKTQKFQCIIQWFLLHLQVSQSPLSNSKHSVTRRPPQPHAHYQTLSIVPSLQPLTTSNSCLHGFVFSGHFTWDHTICGLCVWLLSLSIVFSGLIRVTACVSTSFLSMAKYSPVVWIYTTFGLSTIDGWIIGIFPHFDNE